MTPEEQFAELYRIAHGAATAISTSNAGFVTFDDMRQDAMLWLLEHPSRVEHNRLPDGTLAYQRLVSEVCRPLVTIAQRERREALGYDPGDDYKYSTRLIMLVLPAVFDPDYRPPGLDGSDKVATTSDPAAADNWTAFVADVKRGIDAVCSASDRQVLFTRSVGGWTWREFEERRKYGKDYYRDRFFDAIERICTFLNAGMALPDSPDAGALADALAGAVPPRRSVTTDWDAAGKDRYIEPDL